jgi:hypothetical protein
MAGKKKSLDRNDRGIFLTFSALFSDLVCFFRKFGICRGEFRPVPPPGCQVIA